MAEKKRIFWGTLIAVIFLVLMFSRFSGFLRQSRQKGAQETRESIHEALLERFARDKEPVRMRRQEQPRNNKSSDVHDEVLNYRLQSNERIRRVQTALQKAGYYNGEIDGKLGPRTKRAIKEFQKVKKLTSDGIAGERTWKALSQYLND